MMNSIPDTNAVISLIDDAIADSLGPDWNSFQAAHHVMQWLDDAGLAIVTKPKRGNDCADSPDGRHHPDTSMESGPNNCFYCENDLAKGQPND